MRRLGARLAGLFRRRRYEDDLDAELGFHLDMETEEQLRRGLAPAEARAAALRALGGIARTKEAHRAATGLPWLEDLGRDVRLALRMLWRAPRFAGAVIVLVALGIGANTAVYTVVDGVLLRPLPYPHPEELLELGRGGAEEPGPGQDGETVSALRQLSDDTLRVAAVGWTLGANLAQGANVLHVRAQPVSREYFDVLGVAPRGRGFEAGDEHPAAAPVAVMGGELAARLGGAGSVLGRTVVLGGQAIQVVGVLPPGFRTFPRVDLLLPLHLGIEATGTNTLVLARTKSRAAAQERLAAVTRDLRAGHHLDAATGLYWRDLGDVLAAGPRGTLLLLLGAVGFVLLVTCANVAGLLLVKAQARGPELAVRAALGGGRGRLARQLLTESLVYALIGGAIGVVLAAAGVDALLALAPADLSDWRVAVDGRVLLFSLLLTLTTGLAFGLLPALRASRIDLRSAVAGSSGVAWAAPRQRFRRALLAGELALCTLLLLGAGLLGRTLRALSAVDLGFAPAGVLALGMSPEVRGPAEAAALQRFYAEGLERARAIAGVRAVAVASAVPGRRGLNLPMRVPGADRSEAVSWRYLSPRAFELLGIPVRRGRPLGDDDGPTAPPVAVVNEAFARAYPARGDAVGQVIELTRFAPEAEDAARTIVGVVGDTRDESLVNPPVPTIYVPVAQVPPGLLALSHRYFDAFWLVKTDLAPAAAADRLGATFRAIAPELPFSEVVRLEDVIAARVADQRFVAVLLAVFAGLALCIATTGVYGVAAYSVAHRTREIGIRMALGARPARIVGGILGEALAVGAVGVAIGLAGSILFGPLLGRFLYGVGATDPTTSALVVLVLVVATVAACAPAARRAAHIDPAANLRQG